MTYESFVARWRKWNWEAKRISKISLQPFVNMFVIHFPRTRTIARKQCQPKKRKKGTHKKRREGVLFLVINNQIGNVQLASSLRSPWKQTAVSLLLLDRSVPTCQVRREDAVASAFGAPGFGTRTVNLVLRTQNLFRWFYLVFCGRYDTYFHFHLVCDLFFFSSFCFVLILIFISTIVSDIFLETNYLSSSQREKVSSETYLSVGYVLSRVCFLSSSVTGEGGRWTMKIYWLCMPIH